MLEVSRVYDLIQTSSDIDSYRELNWTGSFNEYLQTVLENPRVCRNAYQRLYDMIMSYGTVEYKLMKEHMVHHQNPRVRRTTRTTRTMRSTTHVVFELDVWPINRIWLR